MPCWCPTIRRAPGALAASVITITCAVGGPLGAQDRGAQALWTGPDDAALAVVLERIRPGPARAGNMLALDLIDAPVAEPARQAHREALARFGAMSTIAEQYGPAMRRGAEALLVLGQNEPLCDAVDTPHDAAEGDFWNGVRLYCLAGAQDPRAELTLGAMLERGTIEPALATLMRAMIDEAFSGSVMAIAADDLGALHLAALAILDLPAPSGAGAGAALPFAPALLDMEPVGERLAAGARLERSGVLPTTALRTRYERTGMIPSAAAAESPDPAQIATSLRRARSGGAIYAPLARAMGPVLAALEPEDVKAAVTSTLADALLLTGEAEAARRWLGAMGDDPVYRALLLLADPEAEGAWTAQDSQALAIAATRSMRAAYLAAALRAFDIEPSGRTPDARLTAIEAGRRTAPMLSALADLAQQPAPDTLTGTLRILRAGGQEGAARAIAVEMAITAAPPGPPA